MSFLAELKRRNVIRMAGLYLVGAWLAVQVAATLLPVFEAPAWVMKVLVALLAIGFVAALVFSWVFELTPEGLKRDNEVPAAASIAPQTARRMDRTIIVALALALGYFAFDKFVAGAGRAPTATLEAASTAPAASTVPPAPVIAVLPFANLSGKADEDYFSDGMTEELLIVLARVPQIQVVARTSVFAFKGKGGDVREIGRQLGVSHIVEGSVRRDGAQVRIAAQLVRVVDGTEIWSESFDRKLESVFALQDEIAARIGEQLVSSLVAPLVASPAQTARTAIDPGAYDEYLKGRALLRARQDLPAAIAHFRAATDKAPALAAAWSSMTLACEALLGMRAIPTAQQQALLDCQAEGARRAAELEPDAAASEHALANLARTHFRYAQAEGHYLRALELDPGYPDAREDYAELLLQVGRVEESAREAEKLVSLDPFFIVGWFRMRDVAFARDRRSDVEMVTRQLRTLYPDNAIGWWTPYHYALANGRADEARAALAELMAKCAECADQEHPLLLRWALRETGVDDAVADALPARGSSVHYFILRQDVPRYTALVESLGSNVQQYYFARLQASQPAGHAMLRDPRVKEKLVEYGFVAYWREQGWPAICRPLGEQDFECNADVPGASP